MKKLRLEDFDYTLPKNLIAQEPIRPRDHSRLLILERVGGRIKHKYFFNLVDYLKAGDVLVLNNTKVMRARLIGRKALTGGKVEVFLLKKIPPTPLYQGGNIWQCLIGGKRRRDNLRVEFARRLKAEILKNNQDGTWNVKFNKGGQEFMKIIESIGKVPLPPYIKRRENQETRKQESKNYQTVYADEKKLGSVAAPTAGFHFTKKLIKQLKKKGVQFEYVTLQVGLGTFAPVKVEDITKHKMHAEWVEVDKNTLENIREAKKEGRRIVAVGTTSARTLESVFSKKLKVKNGKVEGWTDIFIYPGYKFKAVDAMITNFHLPKSTLLMLIFAFSGRSEIKEAYRAAIKKKYRFFSYGDAMFIY